MASVGMLLRVVRGFKNWPTHLLDHFKLLRSQTVTYRLREGAQFKVRTKSLDGMAVREVWIGHEYDPPGFEIPVDGVVVDVGGHIGSFAVYASRRASRGEVYVYEPTPANFKMLEENLRLNSVTNVRAFNLALLGRAGSRQIALCPDNVSNSIVFDHDASQRIDVEGIALTDFMDQQRLTKIDFLKLDCEGAEFEILFQAPDALLSRIGIISAEVHYIDERRSFETLAKFLESKGFQIAPRVDSSPMLQARRSNSIS